MLQVLDIGVCRYASRLRMRPRDPHLPRFALDSKSIRAGKHRFFQVFPAVLLSRTIRETRRQMDWMSSAERGNTQGRERRFWSSRCLRKASRRFDVAGMLATSTRFVMSMLPLVSMARFDDQPSEPPKAEPLSRTPAAKRFIVSDRS